MKQNKFNLIMILIAFNLVSMASEPTSKVTMFEEIEWGYLNPLRGDESPAAANLWGDRTSGSATGMLVKFKKGFSSPPHIHNVSYRGIVIEGLLHNDDASAEKMWLQPGSFWTQPAGEAHITAADGEYNLAYVEIDRGPYLVKPINESFDNGEKPINVDQSNLIWIKASDLSWVKIRNKKMNLVSPEVTFLWGASQNNQLNGLMLKIPPNFQGEIKTKSDTFKAVVIEGAIKYDNAKKLTQGSFFESNGQISHSLSTSDLTTTIYIRTQGELELIVN